MRNLKSMPFVLLLAIINLNCAKAISCNGEARYTLTFQGEWTSARHPDFPPFPHFSAVVGCSHKTSYVMWKAGIKATRGVKNVAELGSTFAINREMDGQISAKNAHKRYEGRVIFGGRASDRITNIEVTSEYPLVSFITTIAPSPDWFIGVHDYSLCNTITGKWKNEISRDLLPYDAGTDSGQFFRSLNSLTNPPENIHLLTNDIDGSLKSNEPVKSFGKFTFVKTFEVNAPFSYIAIDSPVHSTLNRMSEISVPIASIRSNISEINVPMTLISMTTTNSNVFITSKLRRTPKVDASVTLTSTKISKIEFPVTFTSNIISDVSFSITPALTETFKVNVPITTTSVNTSISEVSSSITPALTETFKVNVSITTTSVNTSISEVSSSITPALTETFKVNVPITATSVNTSISEVSSSITPALTETFKVNVPITKTSVKLSEVNATVASALKKTSKVQFFITSATPKTTKVNIHEVSPTSVEPTISLQVTSRFAPASNGKTRFWKIKTKNRAWGGRRFRKFKYKGWKGRRGKMFWRVNKGYRKQGRRSVYSG
ncbi:uncharacterized protein PB18E9.04c-like isoform X2 [Xenia sp. Carnegie-2017]|uniref:uncharacterized protein PB18E9.04c-like isoform X2 n=1 Tax=Xenia sp. Carnegie-2017 TaxID=2897299 RepID=UPI001F043E84|nr:uncharacterized protein PB18E9.04c-like isoform X2 [Xenia sp. Carnegie-2017]